MTPSALNTNMNASRILRILPVTALAALAAGCPATPVADPIEPGPKITSLSVSKGLVDRGEVVTLSWETQNAASVKLENLNGATVPEISATTGSVDIEITADSLFVLTATNTRGAAERQPVQVLVRSAAHDLLLYVLPAEITAGEAATLTWSAPDARSVTLTAAPGGALNLNGQTTVGTLAVMPSASTTYTLTADNKTATASLVVRPKISAFTATPLAAVKGSPLTLSWTVAGATSLTLEGAGRGQLLSETDPAKVAAGTFTETVPAGVDPATVYTYVLTAKDATGAATSRTLHVYVEGTPFITTFTGPTYGRMGQTVTLNWTTQQTDEVTIATGGTVLYKSPTRTQAVSGSLAIPTPAQQTTYVLTALHSRGGSATSSVTVDPVGAPAVSSFTASPTSVAGGAPVTLTWNTTNGRRFRITETTDGVVYAFDGKQDQGTFTVYPNRNSTYTLTVDNSFGETATATANVTVSAPVTLTPSITGTIAAGTPVQLSFNVTGATNIVGLPHSQVDVRNPSTAFDDISSTGAKLPFSATASSGVQQIPEEFPVAIYGQLRKTVRVSVDGYLVFDSPVNPSNSGAIALPTAKIEPFAVAPLWINGSLVSAGGVYWQIKQVGGVPVLIVQWEQLSVSSSPATFQAKVYRSGQIDFEYKTLPSGALTAGVGVQGPIGEIGVAPPSSPVAGSGFTFFGPRPSPVTVEPKLSGPVNGAIVIGNGLLYVSHTFSSVVRARELHISEVMSRPDPAIASTGEWVEVTNNSAGTVDLSGWELVRADGGTHALSGTIPASGSLVFGQSTDPSLNGDAGVSVALSGLDLVDTGESLALRKGAATIATAAVGSPDAGVARSFQAGPFKFSDGGVSNEVDCASTGSYSAAPVGVGTPGREASCGFGYVLSSIPVDYYDISSGGTAHLTTSFDQVLVTLDVSSAPVTLFGTQRSSLIISSNGSITPDSAMTSNNYNNATNPSPAAPNTILVPFGDDLSGYAANGSNIFSQRIGAGVNPRAPVPHWIIQWHNYEQWLDGDDMSFQVKLFDDGVIEFHYAEMTGGSSSQSPAGQTANAWIEHPTGTAALYIHNRSFSPGISPNTAFRFTPR